MNSYWYNVYGHQYRIHLLFVSSQYKIQKSLETPTSAFPVSVVRICDSIMQKFSHLPFVVSRICCFNYFSRGSVDFRACMNESIWSLITICIKHHEFFFTYSHFLTSPCHFFTYLDSVVVIALYNVWRQCFHQLKVLQLAINSAISLATSIDQTNN